MNVHQWLPCTIFASFALAACGGEESLEVEQDVQELLGNTLINTCTVNEASEIRDAQRMGRIIASSLSFEICMESAIGNGFTDDRGVNVGPYAPCAGDPYAASAIGLQMGKAIDAAQSPNDLELTCDHAARWGAATANGYGHLDNEEIALSDTYRNLAANPTLLNRSRMAGALWRFGLETHNYRESSCGVPGYVATRESMPWIADQCISHIMRISDSCTASCGSRGEAVRYYNGASGGSCVCVSDPHYAVGIIQDQGAFCTDPVEIYMDDEDDNNNTSSSGWIGKISSTINTRFHFCRVDGLALSNYRGTAPQDNYAVVRLGRTCPPGSEAFGRYFDNEDDSNNNSSVGHIRPNISVNSYTQLEMCLFTASPTASMTSFPSFSSMRYGVFADSSHNSAVDTGQIYTDDEDDDNSNAHLRNFAGAQGFIHGGSNTTMEMIRVR
jgi:hypothetical protein